MVGARVAAESTWLLSTGIILDVQIVVPPGSTTKQLCIQVSFCCKVCMLNLQQNWGEVIGDYTA